jgi:signal transduction histidine kinase
MNTQPNPSNVSVEQQVEQLQQQLIEAQKLTALGQLVGTTTHEFNNVLMTIINYAKLGLRNPDQASRTKAFERILAAGERAARITNSVLGMARNRSQGMEPTNLAKLIEESLVLLERELARYRVRVETRFAEIPMVFANGNQIQQVVLNLLINARQAMPNGGQILIKLEYDEERQMVDLVVRDTGVGIPPDKLRNIFEPYYSTKTGPDESGRGGTGLGLFTCRNIVESHRGRIRVETALEKGTCFTIKLPVAPAPAPLPVSPPVPSTSAASNA